MKKYVYLLAALLAAAVVVTRVVAQGYDPTRQSAAMWMNEANMIYQGNLARRDHGQPPLRWNRQLTYAARWFTWDAVMNQPDSYCDHQDSSGNYSDKRALDWGYLGSAGAEIAYCGFVTPFDAIQGWLESPSHHKILTGPGPTETGGGYFFNESNGRGYEAMDFGMDPVYPPVVIDNEAPFTTSLNTNLYIYDRPAGSLLKGFAPATEMQVSNDACFLGASWEPYQTEKSWALADGEQGGRSVYVRTRDAMNRTITASDTIYYGEAVPEAERTDEGLSTTSPSVTLYGLDGKGYPKVQFSSSWMADETDSSFSLLWGSGERVQDADAWGGTAYRMGPPGSYSETSTWMYTTDFIKNEPMVAYVRMKVSSNTSSSEVARFSVTGGREMSLKGTDFKAADTYQEFPVAFTFPTSETFLIFQFWRSGSTDVWVDAVTVFTPSQPAAPVMNWAVPGGNYRGQGIWVRYTDDAGHFSAFEDATTRPANFAAVPNALLMIAGRGSTPALETIEILEGCRSSTYQAHSDQPWLTAVVKGKQVMVQASPNGMDYGMVQGSITLAAAPDTNMPAVTIPVIFRVEDGLKRYFPDVLKAARP